jgi:hypothetical protein
MRSWQRCSCGCPSNLSSASGPIAGGVPFRFCKFASSAIWNAVHIKMPPLFVHGFLHWLINPSFFIKLPRAGILSLSLTSETFSWVRSPPFVASQVYLVELDGHLCMVRDLRSGLPTGGMLEIWKLEDYSSGDWSLNRAIPKFWRPSREI